MKSSDAFPGRYLKAADLDGDVRVTIADLCMRTMQQQDGTQLMKPVLYFLELQKALVLNRTNWRVIAEAYGDESDGWIGKKITLGTVQVDAFGTVTNAIRIVRPGRGAKVALEEDNHADAD